MAYGDQAKGAKADPAEERKRYDQRVEGMRADRDSWLPQWRDLGDYILPFRYVADPARDRSGEKRHQNIINSTATMAARTLMAGLMSGVTSPSRPWFKLTIANRQLAESYEVKRWLEDVEQEMRRAFERANLYQVLPSVYLDLGVFGTSAMAILEDPIDLLRAYHYPVGSWMLGGDHRRTIDAFAREFEMTADQLVARFGSDNVSDRVKAAIENGNGHTRFEVCHYVHRNPAPDASKLHASNRAWRSCYWEKACRDKMLGVSGFNEMPILAPRWSTLGEAVYGHSPGMEVLGDTKALQLLEKRKLQGVEKNVNPPLIAPSSLANRGVSVLPGGITYVDERDGFRGMRPLHEQPIPLADAMNAIDRHEARINRGMYVDLFLMFAGDTRSNVTATEIMQRQEEKMLMLGPVWENLNDELLGPLIDRGFAILNRANRLPPAPAVVQGEDLVVEWVSLMAQAQKMTGIAATDRFLGTIGSMAEADPSVLDKVDRDAVIDHYQESLGVSPKLVRSNEEVAAIRADRARRQQQAEQAQVMTEAAKGAKLLSETRLTDDTALSALLASRTGVVA